MSLVETLEVVQCLHRRCVFFSPGATFCVVLYIYVETHVEVVFFGSWVGVEWRLVFFFFLLDGFYHFLKVSWFVFYLNQMIFLHVLLSKNVCFFNFLWFHIKTSASCRVWVRTVECQLAICQVHRSAYPPAELTMAGRGRWWTTCSWWFELFFIFTPKTGGRWIHFWRAYFSKGLVQPPTSETSFHTTFCAEKVTVKAWVASGPYGVVNPIRSHERMVCLKNEILKMAD